MIINIAGTSGSGKSTIVRSIIEAADKVKEHSEGKKILGYTCFGLGSKPLFIVGPYNKPSGGADNIQPLSEVFEQVLIAYTVENNVLFEGLLVSRSKGRLLELWKSINCRDFYIHQLTTSLDDCIHSINLRRQARGNDKPVDCHRTAETFKRVNKICKDLAGMGVPVIRGTRAETLEAILKRLRAT